MVDWLRNVKTDKVIHTIEANIMRLVDEIESFSKSFDEFDKETGPFDRLLPKQADMSCVHALNKLHSHEIRIVPCKHEAGQYSFIGGRLSAPDIIALSARVVIERLYVKGLLYDQTVVERN
nr:hypothetical protein [Tanacetum cinerariifolium]